MASSSVGHSSGSSSSLPESSSLDSSELDDSRAFCRFASASRTTVRVDVRRTSFGASTGTSAFFSSVAADDIRLRSTKHGSMTRSKEQLET